MRPTAALLELDDPFSGWYSHDYRLQEAIGVLDRDTCKTCGNPVWLCHTSHSGVEFDIMASMCYAKAELDAYDKMPGNPDPEAGENRFAKAVGLKNEDGTFEPLPSRSEALAKIASKTLHTQ